MNLSIEELTNYSQTESALFILKNLEYPIKRTSDNLYYIFDNETKLWVEVDSYCKVKIYFTKEYNKHILYPLIELSKKEQEEQSKQKTPKEKLNENKKELEGLQKQALNDKLTKKELKLINYQISDLKDEEKEIMKEMKAKNKKNDNILTQLIKQYGNERYQRSIISLMENNINIDDDIFQTKGKAHELPIMDKKILNLKTLKVRDRTDKDLYTFECKATYNAKTSTKKADKFFSSLMKYDKQKTEDLRNILGILLTGEAVKYIFTFFGDGNNGKSALMDVIGALITEYQTVLSKSLILKQKFKTTTTGKPELLNLKGGRIAVASEIQEGEIVDEEIFKTLSSGTDKIQARLNHSNKLHSFINTSKVVFLLNKPFYFDTDDKASTNRLINVEFEAEFIKNSKDPLYERDENLTDYLTKTQEGRSEVLKWISEGSKNFYDNKKELKQSETLLKMKDLFLSRIDPVKGFLETIKFNNKYNDFYKRGDISNNFKAYLEKTNYKYNPKLKDKVMKNLEVKSRAVKINGYYGFKQLKLKENYKEEEGENLFEENDEAEQIEKLENILSKERKEKEELKKQLKELQNKLNELTEKPKQTCEDLIAGGLGPKFKEKYEEHKKSEKVKKEKVKKEKVKKEKEEEPIETIKYNDKKFKSNRQVEAFFT